MIVVFEITSQTHKPFFITKNLDEYLSIPHLKQSLFLYAIKKYGINVSNIKERIIKISDIKGVSSASWKYFTNIKLNRLLPLNNIITIPINND